MADDNKKCPKSAVDEGDIEPKYGYISGEWRECGGSNWHYENAEDKDKTFSQKTYASGGYDTIEKNNKKKEIHTSLRSGEVRQYVAGGKSTHVDGHHDINSESTFRVEAAGDIGQASGQNYYRGTNGKVVKLEKDTATVRTGSEAVSHNGYTGTHNSTYEKNKFEHIKENHVSMTEKDRADVVKGDYALNSGKNWDTYIQQKGRIKTGGTFLIKTGETATVNSQSKIVLNSQSDSVVNSAAKVSITGQNEVKIKDGQKIVLEVGGSSITIESGSITIKGSQIKFEQG